MEKSKELTSIMTDHEPHPNTAWGLPAILQALFLGKSSQVWLNNPLRDMHPI